MASVARTDRMSIRWLTSVMSDEGAPVTTREVLDGILLEKLLERPEGLDNVIQNLDIQHEILEVLRRDKDLMAKVIGEAMKLKREAEEKDSRNSHTGESKD